MNVWSFTGNVGRDCEVRFTKGGTAIGTFTVAVKKGYGDYEKTVWPVVELFGKRAESLGEYITKGMRIGITGEVYEDEWEDKEGNKRKTLKVVANGVDLLSPKNDTSSGSYQQNDIPEPPGMGNENVPF